MTTDENGTNSAQSSAKKIDPSPIANTRATTQRIGSKREVADGNVGLGDARTKHLQIV